MPAARPSITDPGIIPMISLLTVAVVGAAPLASFSPLPQDPVATEIAPAEHGAEPKWVTDWEAAKAQAKKEGKDLLVDFTGSDWCGWCIKLHEEVFSHAEFSGPATELFVFVELDFPRQKE
jgi:thiol:disulfide interchange protein